VLIYNSSWEANRFAASQEIPRILWNPKVHYHIRKCPPSVSWASSIQSITPHHTYWRSILLFSFYLRLGLPSGIFPTGFLTKTQYTPLFFFLVSSSSSSWLNHSTILGEYRTLRSSLCNFLHSFVTSSLLGINIPLNPYSQTISAYVPPSKSATKFRIRTNNRQNKSSLLLKV
jgi:hypothetical protein